MLPFLAGRVRAVLCRSYSRLVRKGCVGRSAGLWRLDVLSMFGRGNGSRHVAARFNIISVVYVVRMNSNHELLLSD